METLNIIQILAKMGKVLSKIVYIFAIIGVVGCIVGMLGLPFSDRELLKIGGVTIHSFIVNKVGIDLGYLYPLLSGALIVCIGEAVTAKFAGTYFEHEISAGTPFTTSGANELLKLGIITICVPLGTIILSQIVSAIIVEFIGCGETFKIEDGDSVALGVMFIVMSLLCRYGAETK